MIKRLRAFFVRHPDLVDAVLDCLRMFGAGVAAAYYVLWWYGCI